MGGQVRTPKLSLEGGGQLRTPKLSLADAGVGAPPLVTLSLLLRFFSRPSPKAGRELQTELYRIMDDGGREGPLAEPVTGL